MISCPRGPLRKRNGEREAGTEEEEEARTCGGVDSLCDRTLPRSQLRAAVISPGLIRYSSDVPRVMRLGCLQDSRRERCQNTGKFGRNSLPLHTRLLQW